MFLFTEVDSVNIFIILNLLRYPFSDIRRNATIWRISDDDHHRLIPLHFVRLFCLISDGFEESEKRSLIFFLDLCLFERVGEVDLETLLDVSDTSLRKGES